MQKTEDLGAAMVLLIKQFAGQQALNTKMIKALDKAQSGAVDSVDVRGLAAANRSLRESLTSLEMEISNLMAGLMLPRDTETA